MCAINSKAYDKITCADAGSGGAARAGEGRVRILVDAERLQRMDS